MNGKNNKRRFKSSITTLTCSLFVLNTADMARTTNTSLKGNSFNHLFPLRPSVCSEFVRPSLSFTTPSGDFTAAGQRAPALTSQIKAQNTPQMLSSLNANY